MSNLQQSVKDHYESANDSEPLVAKVTRLLDEAGIATVTTSSLALLDQLHTRGAAATRELALLAEIDSQSKVLDAGCGLGGPARFLAETFGCHVTGVDLTPSFIEVARLLTERTGLQKLCLFETGDLTSLDLPDASFDVVWTQHVVMNIRERDRLYTELRRVLKAGGRLVFYDILAGDAKSELLFPVPWSKTPATSHLLTEMETRDALLRAGFTAQVWRDVTASAVEWTGGQPVAAAPGSGLSLATVMGPGLAVAVENLGRNLREGRARIVMGIFQTA